MNQALKNKFVQGMIILILVGLIPILGTEKTMDPNLSLQFTALALLMLAIWILIYKFSGETSIRNNWTSLILLSYFVFVAYSLISVIISNNFPLAVFMFAKYIIFFLLLLALTGFKNPDFFFKMLSVSAVILGIIISIPGYYQLFELIREKQLIIPGSTYSLRSILSHRNLFSELLLLTLPFSAFTFLMERKLLKYMGIICFNMAFFMLVILSNRATWLGMIVVYSLVCIILLIKRKEFLFSRMLKWFIFNNCVLVIAVYFFFSVFSDSKSLQAHAANTLDLTQGSAKDRIELWSRTIKLISEKPAFGSGLGSWEINMLKFGNKGLVSEDNTTFYQRPHNDFLWIAAEQGLIGALLYLSIFSLLIVFLLKSILNKVEALNLGKLLVVLSVSLIFVVFSIFSFPLERISHNLILLSSWGYFLNLLNCNFKSGDHGNINLRKISFLSLPALCFLFILGLIRFNSEVHTKKAILYKKNSRFQLCINEISKAESFMYKIDETSTPLRWYSGLSYFKINNFPKAVEELRSALDVNPYHIYALNDYAGSLVKTGKIDSAIVCYKKAIAIAPNFLEAKLNLCSVLYNQGKFIESFRILITTDADNTSERYRRTVSVVVKKCLDEFRVTTQPKDQIRHLQADEAQNYEFCRKFLLDAQGTKLELTTFIKEYQSNLIK